MERSTFEGMCAINQVLPEFWFRLGAWKRKKLLK